MDCTAFHPSCSKGGVSVYKQEILAHLGSEITFHAFYKDVDPEILPRYPESIAYTTQATGNMLVWRDRAIKRFKSEGARAVWFPTQFGAWFPHLPSVATIHDMAAYLAWNSFSPLAKAYMPATLFATAWHARKLLVVSESSAADLARLFPWSKKKIVIARHGLPSDVRIAAGKRPLSGRTHDGHHRLIFLDGANPRKRLDLCLIALHKQGWRGLELKITGNPVACQKRVQSVLGVIPSQVEFLGFLPRPELLAALAESDVLLYPSDFEGFGFPIIEAMAFGTTVVAFPGGAEKEVGGPQAIYAEQPDAVTLGRTINAALERCQDHAWQTAAAKHALSFTWNDSVAAHKQVFLEMLNN